MAVRTRLFTLAIPTFLGAAALVGCRNEGMHNDNNLRNNNRSDSLNTGTETMQRSSTDVQIDAAEMGVQASERIDGSSMKLQPVDRGFIETAAACDLFEIESSRLAVERATDPSLQKFAQQMINDHEKTSSQVRQMSASKGWDVPARLNDAQQAQLNLLNSAKGDAFDAAYRAAQMKAHAEAIALFDSQSTNGSDPDLKMWARQTLPALEMHADMLKQMGTTSQRMVEMK